MDIIVNIKQEKEGELCITAASGPTQWALKWPTSEILFPQQIVKLLVEAIPEGAKQEEGEPVKFTFDDDAVLAITSSCLVFSLTAGLLELTCESGGSQRKEAIIRDLAALLAPAIGAAIVDVAEGIFKEGKSDATEATGAQADKTEDQ